MKTRKIKCGFCGDTIKGKAHNVHVLYGTTKRVRIDEGCFLLAQRRGIILQEEEK